MSILQPIYLLVQDKGLYDGHQVHQEVPDARTLTLMQDPTYRKAWLNQGQAQEAEDKPNEAMKSYNKTQQLKHDSELATKLVFLQKKVG